MPLPLALRELEQRRRLREARRALGPSTWEIALTVAGLAAAVALVCCSIFL